MIRKRPVEPARLCIGCGYDLRGSSRRGRCPECGLPAYVPSGPDDPLSARPIVMIERFRTAAAFAIASLVVGIAVSWVGGAVSLDFRRWALVPVALLWVASVWMLTPALPDPQANARGFGRTGHLRLAARFLQLGWPLAAGASIARATMTQPSPLLVSTAGLIVVGGIGLGLAGIACLAFLLSRLAEWVRDDAAERAFGLAAWAIPIATGLLLTVGVGSRLPFLLIGGFLTLLWIGSLASFTYALLSLGRSLAWAVVHSREHQERLRRRQDRADAYGAEVAASIAAIDGRTPPAPPSGRTSQGGVP